MSKLTETQRRILEGLDLGGNPPISASEMPERAALEAVGYVETWDLDAESGAGQRWWFDVWRITEAGRQALADAQEGRRG